MSKKQPIKTVECEGIPTASLRKPIFVGDEATQRAWDALWNARLDIFLEVFPWLRPAISELQELPGNTPTGELQPGVAIIAAYDLYRCGYRATKLRDEVIAIHDRQNREWLELTGLPPLGTVEHWRAAAAWAGVSPADFENQDFARLAKCITAKALAKQAEQPRKAAKSSAHQTYTKSDLLEMTGLGATNLLKFMKAAGVKVPKRGGASKTHRYTTQEAREILLAVIDGTQDERIRKKCKVSLSELA